MLRPRFPFAGKIPVRQLASTPVWHKVPSGRTVGRSLVLWKSPFASPGAIILNGLPEPYSMSGATVNPCRNRRIHCPSATSQAS